VHCQNSTIVANLRTLYLHHIIIIDSVTIITIIDNKCNILVKICSVVERCCVLHKLSMHGRLGALSPKAERSLQPKVASVQDSADPFLK
jgi:hypothetical protein